MIAKNGLVTGNIKVICLTTQYTFGFVQEITGLACSDDTVVLLCSHSLKVNTFTLHYHCFHLPFLC